MPSIKFGVPIPQVFLAGRADLALVEASLRRAEELGFDSVWVQDQVVGDVPLLESVSLMCYAAAVTSRVKLGVSVIVFPTRNAVQLAKSISTLDLMSHGRVILGIGLGPLTVKRFYRNFGVESGQSVRRFTEGLRVMKSLWTQSSTDIDGEFYSLKNAGMEPKPLQKPHPPVWFGGQHPDALRRAVRLADGYMCAGPTTNVDFGKHVTLIRRFLGEEGRDPASFPISKRVYLAVDADERRAKQGLDRFFQARYPWMIEKNPNFVADICVWGSPQRVVDGLAKVIENGAEMIVLNPLWDFIEQMEALAEAVVPVFIE